MSDYPEPPPLPRLRLAAASSHSDRGCRPGELRIARGVYLLPTSGLEPWEQKREVTLARCAGALLASPSTPALSHECAAIVHGLPCWEQEPDVQVISRARAPRPRTPLPRVSYAAGDRRLKGRGASIVRRHRDLADDETTMVSGLRVTTLKRTMLDCALDLPVRESVCVLDGGMRALCAPSRRLGACLGRDPEELREELTARLASMGSRRGVRRARAALALMSPWSESPGESVLRWIVAAGALPSPTEQEHVHDVRSGTHAYLDLAWPDAMLGVEFDGYAKYTSRADLRAEKAREMVLRRHGWRVLRVEWRELRDPDAVLRRLRAALGGEGRLRRSPSVRDLWE